MAHTHKVAGFSGADRCGFTLVELLVAATILGILAVFATVSYRSSAAETRWTQAKANADLMAVAVQRFKMDYPNAHFSSSATSFLTNPSSLSCVADTRGYASSDTFYPAELIGCGYLERGDWNNEYFNYFAENACTTRCGSGSYSACVYIKNNAPLPSPYNNGKYAYCVYDTGISKEVKN